MPVVTMIAGPNGSGKSTLTQMLASQGADFGDYLNADDIARTLSGDPATVAAKAQEQVRQLRQQALDDRTDHTFETVLSHPSHIEHLRKAKAGGFKVLVYFVATDDPRINIGRVANRVERGGHDVPNDRIEARYHRSIANLHEALAAADEGAVFDNSSRDDPMRLVAEWRAGSLIQTLPEHAQPNWWREFLADFQN